MEIAKAGPSIGAIIAIIAVIVAWLQNRPKMKMIEGLGASAEKGEETPAPALIRRRRQRPPFALT